MGVRGAIERGGIINLERVIACYLAVVSSLPCNFITDANAVSFLVSGYIKRIHHTFACATIRTNNVMQRAEFEIASNGDGNRASSETVDLSKIVIALARKDIFY